MTGEERAESFGTGKCPERTIEAPDRLFGFGPAATNPIQSNLADLPPMEGLGAAIRDYWRLDGKHNGRREGLKEGLKKGRLEGIEKGRLEGREEALPEKLTNMLLEKLIETFQVANDVVAAKSTPKIASPVVEEGANNKTGAHLKRGLGRPSSLEEEATEMLAIIAANPGRGDHYCRNLFESALREREPQTREGESDGKRWRNQRSKRGWKEAQKKLSDDAE